MLCYIFLLYLLIYSRIIFYATVTVIFYLTLLLITAYGIVILAAEVSSALHDAEFSLKNRPKFLEVTEDPYEERLIIDVEVIKYRKRTGTLTVAIERARPQARGLLQLYARDLTTAGKTHTIRSAEIKTVTFSGIQYLVMVLNSRAITGSSNPNPSPVVLGAITSTFRDPVRGDGVWIKRPYLGPTMLERPALRGTVSRYNRIYSQGQPVSFDQSNRNMFAKLATTQEINEE